MNYAIIGGDRRLRCLAAYLSEDNTVLDCTGRLCDLRDSDCVILPVPAEKNGELFAPLWSEKMRMAELVSCIPEGTPVFGGKFSEETLRLATLRSLRLFDLLQDPDFTAGNAELTAEAAVYRLMGALEGSVRGARVLVIGFGRIGSLLCRKLFDLGAVVTILSANAEKRALARAMGYAAISPGEKPGQLDAAVNTAPARLLQSAEFLGNGCVYLELASAPGGSDAAEIQGLGGQYIAAPGLPGRYAPKSAGELIGARVKSIIKEQNV